MESSISPAELADRYPDLCLLDIRRVADRHASTEQLAGARWKDPGKVAVWSAALSPGQAVVVYCIRGGILSRDVAAALRARGLPARYLEGGIEGWKTAGGRVVGRG